MKEFLKVKNEILEPQTTSKSEFDQQMEDYIFQRIMERELEADSDADQSS